MADEAARVSRRRPQRGAGLLSALSTIIAAVVMIALSPGVATADGVGPMYVATTSESIPAPAKGLYNIDVPVRVLSETSTTGWFWGSYLHFAGGQNAWVGLQTRGDVPDGTLGIFSVWGAVSGSGACDHASPDAPVVCITPMPWKEGRQYRLRVWAIGRDDAHGTENWGAWVIDVASGEETLIGTITVPSSHGWLTGDVLDFTQYFGHTGDCTDLHATARFDLATANAGTLGAQVGVSQKLGPCQPQVKIACDDRGCTHAIDGAGTDQDIDGDGLRNDWESHGIDFDGDGTVDVDLPAMGADPHHKDVFVQLDHMPNLRIPDHAIEAVVQSFANAPVGNADGRDGIALHVDNGPDSLMDPRTGKTWGSLARGGEIPREDMVGKDYDAAFPAVRKLLREHFDEARRSVFRHAASIARFGGVDNGGWAGMGVKVDGVIKPDGDFIVALGRANSSPTPNWDPCDTPCMPRSWITSAGTFMHELGHALGLLGDTRPPNQLSVMNYDYQFTGLKRVPSTPADKPDLDYSRFGPEEGLTDLDEGSLRELGGIGFGLPVLGTYAVPAKGCNTTGPNWLFNRGIDFNCDGAVGPTQFNPAPVVSVNLDRDPDGKLTVLHPLNEWRALDYQYGHVGYGADTGDSATSFETATADQLASFAEETFPPPRLDTDDVRDVTADAAALRLVVDPREQPAEIVVQLSAPNLADRTFKSAVQAGAVQTLEIPLTGLSPATTYSYDVAFDMPAYRVVVAAGREFTTPDIARPQPTPDPLRPPDVAGPQPTPLRPLSPAGPPKITSLAIQGPLKPAPRGPDHAPVSRARYGTRVSFVLSRAATAQFTIERRLPGRRVLGACQRAKKAASGPRCIATVPVRRSAFVIAGHPGTNVFRLMGRAAARRLPAGSYRLVAAVGQSVVRRRFTVRR